MIFYFSGTGNSRYVAEELADALDSDLRFIPRVSPNILAADTVGEYGVGFVFPKKWKFTDDCISCGKCEKICPVGNIKLHDGKPVWGKECISCVACYHICPKNAIQYGSFTKGKGQYFCPKNKLR